jgi:hypothetical protein
MKKPSSAREKLQARRSYVVAQERVHCEAAAAAAAGGIRAAKLPARIQWLSPRLSAGHIEWGSFEEVVEHSATEIVAAPAMWVQQALVKPPWAVDEVPTGFVLRMAKAETAAATAAGTQYRGAGPATAACTEHGQL